MFWLKNQRLFCWYPSCGFPGLAGSRGCRCPGWTWSPPSTQPLVNSAGLQRGRRGGGPTGEVWYNNNNRYVWYDNWYVNTFGRRFLNVFYEQRSTPMRMPWKIPRRQIQSYAECWTRSFTWGCLVCYFQITKQPTSWRYFTALMSLYWISHLNKCDILPHEYQYWSIYCEQYIWYILVYWYHIFNQNLILDSISGQALKLWRPWILWTSHRSAETQLTKIPKRVAFAKISTGLNSNSFPSQLYHFSMNKGYS